MSLAGRVPGDGRILAWTGGLSPAGQPHALHAHLRVRLPHAATSGAVSGPFLAHARERGRGHPALVGDMELRNIPNPVP